MTDLTIGLPVYNAMPFLEESLGSLLAQSDPDFKILAIDDGSTDASLAYLRSVQDPRLRIATQPNRGLTFTLNRMLREVDTPWLVRHDADDVTSTDRVAITRRAIEQHPDAAMFYSEARYYQEGSSLAAFRTTKATPEELRQLTASGYLLAICHPAVTLNTAKALAVGGYRFDLHIEDIDLWWRLALQYSIQYLPAVTSYVRHNSASVSMINLEGQSINALYVQYLLLSHLHGWSPLSYAQVRPLLARYVNKSRLKFRERIRAANISYSEKAYWQASTHAMRAAWASPSAFVKRVLYEVQKGKPVFNGENPEIFLRDREQLWPTGSDSAAPAQPVTLAGKTSQGTGRGPA